jgi:cyclohexyl-isocyanide hydratase
VVIDGNLISTAGVSAGIDGSLRLAAMLAGEAAAQRIQLDIEYSPEPPFDSGTPAHAPAPIVNASRERSSRLTAARLDSAQRAATRLRTAGPTAR